MESRGGFYPECNFVLTPKLSDDEEGEEEEGEGEEEEAE